MIDFTKIGSGATVDTVLPPREIFNALPKKDAAKFQYPRDVQSQVWTKWYENRDRSTVVIKMNTGSGKTVVGLLILKSCLNEGKGPAVYVCPDKYLVKQVMDAAEELGIDVTDDVESSRFISGKSILIANIYKIVNGKSVFGVGDEGAKIRISSLLVDDAHASFDIVEDQFTLRIPYGTDLYNSLLAEFRNSLTEQCETKLIEIESHEPASYMQVPYWAWQEKMSDVSRILVAHSSEYDLKFVWPLLKEELKLCNCIVSSREIEISPQNIPIHMIPSIVHADRKIFMTANLIDDSILASHFGIQGDFIKSPITPDSAGDIGDRIILLPQVINSNITDIEIKEFCKSDSREINVVIIVPSVYRSNFWRDAANLVLTSTNLYDGIEQLKKGHVGLVVLVNRYDGIDLPGNACRLLVIDGFPDVRSQIDKVRQGLLMGTQRQDNNVIQRIEQGMGRGVRSNDDYCAVLLIGKDLTSHLYSQGAMDKFSPGTRAQLVLSEQVSDQIKGRPLSDLTEIINYCLTRDEKWVKASKGVLASLKYSDTTEPDKITITLRHAYDLASQNNYPNAAKLINELVNSETDAKLRGYLKQSLAEYVNLFDRAEAQKIQMSANSDNRRVLKPIAGIQYNRLPAGVMDQAAVSSSYMASRQPDPNKLIIEVDGIIDQLQFKEDTSNAFEESLKVIARFIGFESQRPEQEYKKGPDVLWKIGESQFLVIECKNEATSSTISKDYCNQLGGSCNWFEEKYGTTSSYVPILVHPSTMFEYACSPKSTIRIITKSKLADFCNAVRQFIRSVAAKNEIRSQSAIRDKLIAYKLKSTEFVPNFTEAYRVKNQP